MVVPVSACWLNKAVNRTRGLGKWAKTHPSSERPSRRNRSEAEAQYGAELVECGFSAVANVDQGSGQFLYPILSHTGGRDWVRGMVSATGGRSLPSAPIRFPNMQFVFGNFYKISIWIPNVNRFYWPN